MLSTRSIPNTRGSDISASAEEPGNSVLNELTSSLQPVPVLPYGKSVKETQSLRLAGREGLPVPPHKTMIRRTQ